MNKVLSVCKCCSVCEISAEYEYSMPKLIMSGVVWCGGVECC